MDLVEKYKKINSNHETIRNMMSGLTMFDRTIATKLQVENIILFNEMIKIAKTNNSRFSGHPSFERKGFINNLAKKAYFSLQNMNLGITDLWASIFADAQKNVDSEIRYSIENMFSVYKMYFDERDANLEYRELAIKLTIIVGLLDEMAVSKSKVSFINYFFFIIREQPMYTYQTIFPIIIYLSKSAESRFSLDSKELLTKYFSLIVKKVKLRDTNEEFIKHILDLMAKRIFNKSQKDIAQICHFTSKASLEKIIESRQLRLSKPIVLNDLDEGKWIWNNTNSNIKTLSFTLKKDSLDLWGNYTKFDGVSLVFDSAMLINFSHLAYSNERTWGISSTFGGMVNYSPLDKKIFKDFFENCIAELIKNNPAHEKLIRSAFTAFKNKWTWMFKKQPWSYEEELRIIVNDETIDRAMKKEMTPLNFELKNGELFINFPTSALKEIIISPYLKNSSVFLAGLKSYLRKQKMSKVKILHSEANIQKM